MVSPVQFLLCLVLKEE
uniref:Uncharacterized protein n=1 Tax=Arundo donax TaxID=35708 RepID=A0A0A9EC30_ARUDO